MDLKSKTWPIAFFLYVCFSFLMLWPFASSIQLPIDNDMSNHLFLLQEAGRALSEGQFPIRVLPRQYDGWGYPGFQFYSSLPYTVGAVIEKVFVSGDPYTALRLLFVMALSMAGLGMYGFCRQMGCTRTSSFLSGLAYLTAPYLLFNLSVRCHVTEMWAQALMPWLMGLSWALYVRPTWMRAIVVSGVYALLAQTHHITFLYGGALCAVFVAGHSVVVRSPGASKYGALAVWGALLWGTCLSLYIYWPILIYRYSVYITAFENPFSLFPLTWKSLLSVFPLVSPSSLATGGPVKFLPGVGVLFLAAAGCSLFRPVAQPKTVRWIVFFFVIAVLAAWSPVDFWGRLPRAFWFVQFPYRFLTYSAMFGALLLAFVSDTLLPVSAIKRRIVLGVGTVSMLLLSYPWSAAAGPQHPFTPSVAMAQREMTSGYYDYLYCPHPFLTRSSDFTPSDLDTKALAQEWTLPPWRERLKAESAAPPLDVLNRWLRDTQTPAWIDPEGLVLPPNIRALYQRWKIQKPLTLDETRKMNRAMLQLRFSRGLAPSYLPLLETLPALPVRDLVQTVEQTAPFFHRVGKRMEGTLSINVAGVYQLPILHYPKLMRVYLNGQAVPVHSSYFEKALKDERVQFQLVALELPIGTQKIEAEFTGHAVTNTLSAVGWGVTGLVLLLIVLATPRKQEPVHR